MSPSGEATKATAERKSLDCHALSTLLLGMLNVVQRSVKMQSLASADRSYETMTSKASNTDDKCEMMIGART
jgi:uncharacterized protein YsxB (DUF464 family)